MSKQKLKDALDKAFGDHGYFTRDVPVSHSVLLIVTYLFLLLVFCLTRI